jgi:hypothetical protein
LPAQCPAALRAIIRKALAPDVERRYATAATFGGDLKLFLEGAETIAEQEKRGSWKPNPTLEAAQPEPRAVPHIVKRIAGGAACVLTGMLLFMGTSYCSRYWTGSRQLRATLDWELYQDLQYEFGFLGRYSPVERLQVPLRAAYEQVGMQAIGRGDWHAAEVSLGHAAELGAADKKMLARLAFARGRTSADLAAARARFREAARLDAGWADPHVALARTYLRSPDEALVEIRAAERLGYAAGGKESLAIAVAYRGLGFEALEAGDVAAARLDFSRAQGLKPELAVPDLRPGLRSGRPGRPLQARGLPHRVRS